MSGSTKLALVGLGVVGVGRLALSAAMYNPDVPGVVLGIAGWMLAPVLVALAIVWRVRSLPGESSLVLMGLTLVFGITTYIFLDAFYIHPDPQGGIALLTIPLIDWLGVVLVGAVLVAGRFHHVIWPSARRSQ